MKRPLCFIVMLSLLWIASILPVSAEDGFHLTYQQENLSSDGQVLTGDLILSIVNVSGENVQDLVAWIAGPNNVTYNNDRITLGDLASGAQKGALHLINVPDDTQNPTGSPSEAVWTVEYTDPSGERMTAEIVGQKVD